MDSDSDSDAAQAPEPAEHSLRWSRTGYESAADLKASPDSAAGPLP